MQIVLSQEHEDFLRRKIADGRYHSVSEAVQVALALLEEREDIRQRRIAALNREIDKGLESLKAGRVFSSQEVYQELLERRKSYKG